MWEKAGWLDALEIITMAPLSMRAYPERWHGGRDAWTGGSFLGKLRYPGGKLSIDVFTQGRWYCIDDRGDVDSDKARRKTGLPRPWICLQAA